MANENEWKCKSCGHDQRNIQIRMVNVNLGVGAVQVQAISPINSCAQCGTQQLDYTINIGELVQVGQVLQPKAPPEPQAPTTQQLEKVAADLKEPKAPKSKKKKVAKRKP